MFGHLAFVVFVPLFFAIQNKSPKKAFLIAFIYGFIFYLAILWWLYHVTVAGLIVLCLYLALYFAIFGLAFNFSSLQPSAFSSFLIPFVWILLEYLQARLFTGFGWTALGYLQYKNLPLIQIADFSGVYGVSFLVMMVNVVVFRLLKKSFREIIVAGVVITAVIGYGMVRLNEVEGGGRKIKVSVIQGNIPQELKWDPYAADSILDKYELLTKIAALDNPDLIVWPETSFPGFLEGDRHRTDRLLDSVEKIGIPLLLGANALEGTKNFNSAVLVSKEGEIIDKYDKIHLVPFGEYVPFSEKFPILHRLVLGELGEFTPGKKFKIFSLEPRTSSLQPKFATLICFEDIFPELARRFVKEGAEFLAVITNDAWYGSSPAPYQHAACSVFRAIENRVPIVRCANTGYSCFIDSHGRIYADVEENSTHLFITGYKTSEIRLGR